MHSIVSSRHFEGTSINPEPGVADDVVEDRPSTELRGLSNKSGVVGLDVTEGDFSGSSP